MTPQTAVREARVARIAGRLPLGAFFGATIALSAFLLFSVEPLVGRLVLPVFGGAPAVWATILAFFQAVLLLGYLYAHVISTRTTPRSGVAIHLAAVVVAVVATATAPRDVDRLRVTGVPPAVELLWILVLTVGPAAFVISATTPLLSAWFVAVHDRERTDRPQPAGDDRRELETRADHADYADPAARRDPYWLYALSNAGSLLALLAYPLVIEPRVGLAAQRTAWVVGLGILAVLLLGAGLRRIAVPSATPSLRPDATRTPATAAAATGSISRARRGRWLLLAAVPSGLLAAVTTFITTDLVAAPLLWVIPLAIYLGSFIVAFSQRGRRMLPIAERIAPAAVTLLWVPIGSSAGWPIAPLLLIEYVGLAIVATTLHGRLALDRPGPAQVTDFYVTQSVGGVLGGAFVGIVAPMLFKGVWELPILLALALVALAITTGPPGTSPATRRRPTMQLLAGSPGRLAPFLVVAAACLVLLGATNALAFQAAARWFAVGGLLLLFGGSRSFLAVTTTVVLVLATFVLPPAATFRDRSFFGVVEVLQSDPAITLLMHGTTVHGAQWTDPARRNDPPGYYARPGPAGDLFAAVRAARPVNDRVGIVGLGAGALAAYTGAGDDVTLYEIDPLVARVATDPRFFTWLRNSAASTRIMIGDGRLSVAAEPPGRFDILVLDAFSSDAVPVHLITVEALADALRVTNARGIVAVHVSNRYYELAPVIGAAADALGAVALERLYTPTDADAKAGASISDWVVLARDNTALEPLVARGWQPIRTAARPFTDDYADLLDHLRGG